MKKEEEDKLVRKSKLVNGKYCGLNENLRQNRWEYMKLGQSH